MCFKSKNNDKEVRYEFYIFTFTFVQVFSFRVLKTLHNKTLRDKMEADTAILLRHTIRLGQEGSIKMEALPALPGSYT